LKWTAEKQVHKLSIDRNMSRFAHVLNEHIKILFAHVVNEHI